MKKNSILSLIFITFLSICYGQQDQQKVLTKDDYEHAVKFLGFNTFPLVYSSYVRPNWMENGKFWYRNSTAEGNLFVLVDPKQKSKQTAEKLEELIGADTSANNRQQISRTEVASPDGSKVAFIRDWNLWIRDTKTNEETRLTTNGIENYGYATDNAGWRKSDKPILLWSPDSKKIATYRQDQRHVSDMYLVETTVGEPKLQQWKYPIPQDDEIIKIERLIIDTESGEIIPLQIPADPRRGTSCDDISCSGSFDDNQWTPNSEKLAFVSSSRDHKIARMRIADAKTGEVREIFTEEVPTQYESGQGSINWRYLPDSNEVIWYSERDNWGHLYLYDAKSGELKNQITKGDFVVTRLLKVDEEKRRLYFMANGREKGRDPYFSHFYSINFSGKNLELLTPEDGNHSVNISPEGDYFVDNYSQPDVPNISVLRNMNGKKIMELEQQDISALKAEGWQPPKPITVKSANGRWDLYGLMFTPTTLDESKKYPVVNYIYPGPQGGGVGSRSFSASRRDHQALAELGFVVVVIDGTCNPGRSKAFHDACYGNMADNTLEDQIAGLKQLAEKYPYLDLERVGIWGHSGGGFATAAAMFRYPEFYKVGISESGNHDNRNYEDDWGEHYIGLLQENEEGSNYEIQANQNYAENLQGDLLIAHGGLDDNVPPYNTYLLIDALIDANKDFDLIIFPNARHGYGEDNSYMMRRRWDYFVKNLMGAVPPEGFEIKRDE
ncbi:DPP IV N-terminal domain-containing protein [Zunongwangia sp. F363]|uniref:DPP IV N-terminal domain-containing protein n=1 Tax=Autumnicola tepida TaxID=3075595 RepID=A0ABU3CED7_9FLAO|nr:DPP IV N-terminal domain-containing protein [Zunongwangia sp. F363]MDT0644623.1 DPP IV N-terminal domain-containing protein [Zunongwangia sp. F363]